MTAPHKDHSHRRPSREEGQSLVEMALGFVVLLIILMGLIDLGRAYFIHVALEDSAGEAAVYLAINPDCRYAGDDVTCTNPNNAEYRARTVGGGEVDWNRVSYTFNRSDPYSVGDPVSVIVKYSFMPITPLISRIASDGGITLTASASQVIISDLYEEAPVTP